MNRYKEWLVEKEISGYTEGCTGLFECSAWSYDDHAKLKDKLSTKYKDRHKMTRKVMDSTTTELEISDHNETRYGCMLCPRSSAAFVMASLTKSKKRSSESISLEYRVYCEHLRNTHTPIATRLMFKLCFLVVFIFMFFICSLRILTFQRQWKEDQGEQIHVDLCAQYKCDSTTAKSDPEWIFTHCRSTQTSNCSAKGKPNKLVHKVALCDSGDVVWQYDMSQTGDHYTAVLWNKNKSGRKMNKKGQSKSKQQKTNESE